jgi:hypothetical protein
MSSISNQELLYLSKINDIESLIEDDITKLLYSIYKNKSPFEVFDLLEIYVKKNINNIPFIYKDKTLDKLNKLSALRKESDYSRFPFREVDLDLYDLDDFDVHPYVILKDNSQFLDFLLNMNLFTKETLKIIYEIKSLQYPFYSIPQNKCTDTNLIFLDNDNEIDMKVIKEFYYSFKENTNMLTSLCKNVIDELTKHESFFKVIYMCPEYDSRNVIGFSIFRHINKTIYIETLCSNSHCGKIILNYIIKYAEKNSFSEIELISDVNAVEFYEKIGFKVEGPRDVDRPPVMKLNIIQKKSDKKSKKFLGIF